MTTSLMIAGVTILLAAIVIVVGLFVYSEKRARSRKGAKQPHGNYASLATEEVDHLFTAEFRNELRNRGILRFERIINENATSLQRDITATVAHLNEYTQKEMGAKLNEELGIYNKALLAAQQTAIASLQKNTQTIDEERAALSQALQQKVAEREAALVKAYEENMAKIIEHYLMETLGEQLDFKSQLPYIMSQMEANKQAILEDMQL